MSVWNWKCFGVVLVLAGCSNGAHQNVPLPFLTLMQGWTGTLRSKTDFVVARTRSEWEAAWQLPNTDQYGNRWGEVSVPPAVDFSKDMVLGIVSLASPSGCAAVTVTSVRQARDHLEVEYSGFHHHPDEVCTAAFFAPYVFVAVPSTSGEIRFVEVQPK